MITRNAQFINFYDFYAISQLFENTSLAQNIYLSHYINPHNINLPLIIESAKHSKGKFTGYFTDCRRPRKIKLIESIFTIRWIGLIYIFFVWIPIGFMASLNA